MILLKFIKNKFFRKVAVEEILQGFPSLKYNPRAKWSDYTTLGAGLGTFPLIKVNSIANASGVVAALCKKRSELTLRSLGGGTNLVGADRILPDTIFIKLDPGEDFGKIELYKDGSFLAGAANSLKNVLDHACACGYGGAAGLYGIPGTIGGAAMMNAGANGQSISDFIGWVEYLDLKSGRVQRLRREDLEFSYRKSPFTEDQMILRVSFRFVKVDPAEEKLLHKREMMRRMKSPPGRSAGSIFKNPAPSLPAGKILELCGAKEVDHGRFQVSRDHANWVINRTDRLEEKAAEKDFIAATEEMAQRVYDSTGIMLKPEVRFVDMESAENWGKSRSAVKVLVLKGGVSSEREVSLLSAANVAQTLREAGFAVTEYDIQKLEITDAMREADVVYPVLHGGYGEDGTLQRMLEEAGIPTVGSSSRSMEIVMDKAASKKVMDEHGVNNAKYAVITDPAAPVPEGMEFPLIVKPNSEGSTFGLTLVEDAAQWREALETALKYDKKALIEEYIDGVEATVGILLGKALPLVEIRYPGKLYDYDAKYTHAQGETLYLCPPEGISPEAQKASREMALTFAKAVGAETLVRVDVMIRKKDDKVFVLEGNSMPGCTASSLLPKAAMASGITLMELYSGLVMDALKKSRKI